MPKQGKEHAYGPYFNADRGTWRVVIVRADGERASQTFESEAKANAVVEAVRNATNTRTIGDAVSDYLESLRAGGARPSTLATTKLRLEGILRLRDGDRMLRSVTPRQAEKLYAQRQAEVSAATHRGELGCAVRLFDHCRARRGWIPSNPFESVEAVGVPGRGKPQLRVDEARRLLALLTRTPGPEATAVMICLLMGMRAHEVVQRVGRDVDNGGRLLWIPNSKTAAGVRQLQIPSVLVARIGELVRGPTDRLFKFGRYKLWEVTQKFAAAAGVPRVTPHGLRGTFATLAVTGAGLTMGPAMSVNALAPQFGHDDDGTTMRRHYLAPGAEQSANVARLEGVLGEPEGIDADLN